MTDTPRHPFPDAKAIIERLAAKDDLVGFMRGHLEEIQSARAEAQISSEAARAVLTPLLDRSLPMSTDLLEAVWACLNRLDAALDLVKGMARNAEEKLDSQRLGP